MSIEFVTDNNIQKVSKFFKSLGDPTRLKILIALSEGEKNVTAITTVLDMEQSAVSHQLKILRDHHLVKTRKEGKTVYYSLDDQHVIDILQATFTHTNHVH